MPRRLVALILTSSIALLGACSSGDSEADPTPRPTSSPPSPSDPARPEPAALRLKGHLGTTTYCLEREKETEDYLWSGPWLAARDDTTITGAAPVDSANLRVVRRWIVEDARDDGEIVPWSMADHFLHGMQLVPAGGARLTAGSAYRVVLRLRPSGPLPSEMSGLAVHYTSGGQSRTITDDSTLRITTLC